MVQIDSEMNEGLAAIVDRANTRWQGFLDGLSSYVQMASEPGITRIVLFVGPAMLVIRPNGRARWRACAPPSAV